MIDQKEKDWEDDLHNDEYVREYTKSLIEKIKKTNKLIEYTDEEDLITLTLSETMIVHFYNPAFKKCILLNNALNELAYKFPNIKFVKIKATDCLKMCASIAINVLPYLVFFKNGYIVDNLVGFEKFGNSEILNLEKLKNYIENHVINTS